MALEDVQKLAEATNSVSKKEYTHWYLSKFEGEDDEEESESPSRAQKSSGSLARNQILQAHQPLLGSTLRKGLTQATLDTHIRSALNPADCDKTH